MAQHAGADWPEPTSGPIRYERSAASPDDHWGARMAARIRQVFPGWYIMWGAYSRELWAYPMFGVPAGTIVHSADPNDLAEMMRAAERAVEGGLC